MYRRYYIERKIGKTPKYQQRYKNHDFLKYWRIVRYYVMRRYKISYPDLELLLYLYDEGVFTKTDFKVFTQCMNWKKGRFEELVERGFIRKWRSRSTTKHADLYELTQTAKLICSHTYKKLMQEEPISETPQKNVIFKGEKYMDKVYRNLIKKMNEKTKGE